MSGPLSGPQVHATRFYIVFLHVAPKPARFYLVFLHFAPKPANGQASKPCKPLETSCKVAASEPTSHHASKQAKLQNLANRSRHPAKSQQASKHASMPATRPSKVLAQEAVWGAALRNNIFYTLAHLLTFLEKTNCSMDCSMDCSVIVL